MIKNYLPHFVLMFASLPALVGQQIADPSMPRIQVGDVDLVLEEWITIPSSSSSRPLARINHLRELPDGSGRMAVNDLNGPFWLIVNEQPQMFVNLKTIFSQFIEAPGLGVGFASFDFHPEYAQNGKFYTVHTERPGSGTADYTTPENLSFSYQGVLTEWTQTNPSSNTFSGTRREMMRVNFYGNQHGFQEIVFNPYATPGHADYGLLFVCLGDTGLALAEKNSNLQRLDVPYGTVMRIDPFGNNAGNGKYGFPADNPWASDGNSNTLGEIWVRGFRNPHRLSWDPVSGKVLLGDIGEKNFEEVNLLVAGNNYGWPDREGNLRNLSGDRTNVYELPSNDASFGYTYPVAHYTHEEGRAIVGGFVYRGNQHPDLYGKYLFGDIVSGRMFYVPENELTQGQLATVRAVRLFNTAGQQRTLLQLINDSSRTDLRFGEDRSNNLYILTKRDAKIRRIVPQETSSEPAEGIWIWINR